MSHVAGDTYPPTPTGLGTAGGGAEPLRCPHSIRSVMQKYLEDRGEVTFDKIFAQKIGELGTRAGGHGRARGGAPTNTGGPQGAPSGSRDSGRGHSLRGRRGGRGAGQRSRPPPCTPHPITSPALTVRGRKRLSLPPAARWRFPGPSALLRRAPPTLCPLAPPLHQPPHRSPAPQCPTVLHCSSQRPPVSFCHPIALPGPGQAPA